MTGDTQDIAGRIRAVLPARWFPDDSPVLEALTGGLAAAWAGIYAMLAVVRAQGRLSTASGTFIDAIAGDFFGQRLRRRATERDGPFRARVAAALQREHTTRAALREAVNSLTGREPAIFEPARPMDTGCYGGPALGYGAAGAWGSMALPFQVFVTVRRPPTAGIALIAGYGTAGPLVRANLDESGSQITDTDIFAAIASVMPTASTAWTRITN